MKQVIRRVGLLVSIALLALSFGKTALAASYDVSASVAFPVPTQAAVINTALNNVTVQNAAFLLSGTCQSLTPTSVISVWRGATSLGSQVCTSNSFSIQINLSEGANTLVVRTANVSNVYGPDSAPITVTLRTPVVTPTPPTQTPPAATTPGAANLTSSDNTAFNNAAKSGLTITPPEPFSVLPTNNQVQLSFYIDGGSTPYTVELNWGDGTTETKVVEKPGTYTFTHQYRKSGNYTVKGRIKDVLGAVSELSHAVVAVKPLDKSVGVTTIQASPTKNTPITWLRQHALVVTVGSLVVGVALVAYWLGQSAALHGATSANASTGKTRAPRKAKANPKGKK